MLKNVSTGINKFSGILKILEVKCSNTKITKFKKLWKVDER